MTEIGDRYSAGKSYIAEMIMAAEIFRQAMIQLEPRLTLQGGRQGGEIVGRGGGFILSSGCEVPHNAPFVNVKALIEAGKKYTPRHSHL